MSSTICALATPPGAGGIAVVRVSGPEAYAVVGEIFTPRNSAKVSCVKRTTLREPSVFQNSGPGWASA